MNPFLSLVKVNLKTSWRRATGSGKNDKNSTLKKIGGGLLIVILLLSLVPTFGMTAYNLTKQANAAGLGEVGTGTLVMSLNLILIFLGILAIPSALFFSNNMEIFMTMPFSSSEIFSANFLSIYINQLLGILFMGVPLIGGSLMAKFSLKILISWIILILTVPMFMTTVIALLFMLIMSLVPGLRDKNRLSLITGFFSIIFSIIFYLGVQYFNNDAFTAGNAFLPVMEQNISLISLVFPTVKGGMLMINGEGALGFLTGLAIVIILTTILVLVTVVLAKPMYFRLLLSMSSGGKKEKKLSQKEIGQSVSKGSSPYLAIIKREWKTLVRTPAYMLNVVVGVFFMPLWIAFCSAVPLFMNRDEIAASGFNIGDLQTFVNTMLNNDMELKIALAILVGAGIGVMSFMNGPTATSVSREGKHIEFLKTLPMKARGIFLSIFACSYLLAFSVGLVILLVLNWLTSFDILVLGLSLLSFIIMSLAISLLEFNIDMMWPNLDWEDETKAVKGGKNTFIAGILPLVLIGGSFALVFLTGINILISSTVIIGIALLVMLFALLNVLKNGKKYLLRMNV